jgi:hypothetical protein
LVWIIQWLGVRFVSGIAWAIVLGCVIFIVLTCIRTLRWLYVLLRPRTFPPGYFKPEQWKALIKSMSPARQAEMIVRTDHQSLGLTPEVFYDVLCTIEAQIVSDPAQSAYWQHRGELEQVLKQERRG